MTAIIQTGTDLFGPAKWIVDPTSGSGTHTTIATALTSASSGDTIFIRPGTYTENLTLKAGVNLTAYGSDASLNGTGNVIIIGKSTFTGVGSVSISGIQLQTNSDFVLAVTGSSASIVNLINCYINCTNNTGISLTSSSSSAQIMLECCLGDLGTTGIGIFSNSSAGSLLLKYTVFTNTGASTTASTSSAGKIDLFSSSIKNPITTSGTSAFSLNNSQIDPSAQNATALTAGGSAAHTVVFSYLASGSASAISVGNNLGITNSNVVSNNTNAITGGGSINYSNLALTGSSRTINTTTQTLSGTIQGSANTAPSAGFIGEQLRATRVSGSSTSLVNNTAKSVASVSLTPGIWDVTGIITFTAAASTSVTECITSLSTTDNTLGGNSGDQQCVVDYNSAQVGVSPTVVVPAFRVTISANTTHYLVAQSGFTISTMVAYGRISATRVG